MLAGHGRLTDLELQIIVVIELESAGSLVDLSGCVWVIMYRGGRSSPQLLKCQFIQLRERLMWCQTVAISV